ncbi:hypothetical protein LOTGIDRAFT_152510 [Lottia gigantea]|uniref:N-acetyltransferase domain-containing protein n=1 Tax=Lottia gigantea TaxID=225164 RepID=V4CSW0_LOTGI|nr:hypothetical protein LOTGIDRAFT_152510 [Lottia gigantea]ESP05645.1 hypothetical protein LOTGIDRAFT_152510 [Lottia gigantea]
METVIVKFEWYRELLKKLDDFFPDSQKLEFLETHHAIVTKNKEQLKKMLQTPGVINWKSCCRFAAINKRLHDVKTEVSEKNGGKLTMSDDVNIWSVTSETLKTLSIPEGFSLKPLTKADVDMVVTNWNFADDGVLEYITALIDSFSSVALYNQGQQLVGYMLESNYGTIGFLHVFEEFRGQGYSKVIVSSLAKKLLENGRQVHVYIYSNNTVSRNLHKGLGFQEHPGIYSWLVHDPL